MIGKPLRIADKNAANVEDDGFIVRSRPIMVPIIVLFSIAFIVIYVSSLASHAVGDWFFFPAMLLLILGSLGVFIVVYATRHRDLTLATEFMNTLLSSATQLSGRFSFITDQSGSVVYIDSGFQKLFPQFMQRTVRTIDALFYSTGLPKEIGQKMLVALREARNDRFLLPMQDTNGVPVQMMVTLEALPKPRGYFLFRGRNYVEKRGAEKSEMDTTRTLLLAQALLTLPDGLLVAEPDGKVIYANRTIEEWLGYGQGELISLLLEQICQGYIGNTPAAHLGKDYTGTTALRRKNGTFINTTVRQVALREGVRVIGMCTVFRLSTDKESRERSST